MYRFYCPIELSHKTHLSICKKDFPREFHHLKNVLRLKKGCVIRVFNGKGEETIGKIHSISANTTEILITDYMLEKRKKIPITLACAVPKRSKFDLILEKCSELDVDKIVPLITQHTEWKNPHQRFKKKNNHYREIMVAAAKQCGRKWLPEICMPQSFTKTIESIPKGHLSLIAVTSGDRMPLITAINTTLSFNHHNGVVIFIGPEGDFSNEEISLAISKGCIPVSLGKNILRVETAAILAVGIITTICRMQEP